MLKFMKVLTQEKYHEHVPCSYAYKVVCVDDRFSKSIVVYRGSNAAKATLLLKLLLKNTSIVKK